MKPNLGIKDRFLRLTVGVILFVYAYQTKSSLSAILGFFAVYEAIVSWCVFHRLIGRNTCPIQKPKPLFIANHYFLGLLVLLTAIIVNALAIHIGWSTWYSFLQDPTTPLTLDNYLFLFIIYPITLILPLKALNKL